MVTNEQTQQLTQEAWRGLDRRQRVELAIKIGEFEFAEWMKVVGFDEDLTPEWDAEDARVAAERAVNGGASIPAEEVEARLERDFPEDAEFDRRLEAKFPGAGEMSLTLDPYTPAGREFFLMLHAEFPQDMEDYLGSDYFVRTGQ